MSELFFRSLSVCVRACACVYNPSLSFFVIVIHSMKPGEMDLLYQSHQDIIDHQSAENVSEKILEKVLEAEVEIQ